MTDKEKALRLNRAHDSAIEHMRMPWHDHYAYPTFVDCLAGLREIKTGERLMQMLVGDPDDGSIKAQQDEEYTRAQGAIRILLAALFQNEREISDEEFATDDWQVLFEIQYPEARS